MIPADGRDDLDARIAAGDKDDLVALIGEKGAVARLSLEQQLALAGHRSVDVPRALAQHAPDLAPDAMRALAKSGIFTARRNLAKSGGADLPEDVLELLADDEDDVVRAAIAAVWSPDPERVSPEAARRRSEREAAVARIAAASSLDDDELAAVVKGGRKDELLALVDNPALLGRCTDEQQVRIAEHRSVEVPRALARHGAMLCPEAVRALAGSRIYTARRALVRYSGSSLPLEVRDLLRDDPDEVVRKLVADLGREEAPRATTSTAPSTDARALSKAAKAGDVEAMAALGLLAWEKGDARKARTWFEQAAAAGDVLSMLDLESLALEAGDADGARAWLRRAAEAGHPGARLRLGDESDASRGPRVPPQTDYRGATLRRKRFAGFDLSGCDFEEADLAGADLHEAQATGVSFREASLTGADLRGARFVDVDFTGAAFGKLNAVPSASSPFRHARLCDAEFVRCRFDRCTFDGVDLTGARFEDATFEKASFTDCDLAEVRLAAVSFDRTLFLRCDLKGLEGYRAVDCVLVDSEGALRRGEAIAIGSDAGSTPHRAIVVGDRLWPDAQHNRLLEIPLFGRPAAAVATAIGEDGIFAGRAGALERVDPAACSLEHVGSVEVDSGAVAVLSPAILHPGVRAHWSELDARDRVTDASAFAAGAIRPGGQGPYQCFRVHKGKQSLGVLVVVDEYGLAERGWNMEGEHGIRRDAASFDEDELAVVAEMVGEAQTSVGQGGYDEEGLIEWLEILTDTDDQVVEGKRRLEIAHGVVHHAISGQIALQAEWPDETDCDRLDRAFADLRKAGVVTSAGEICCSTCSHHELAEEVRGTKKAHGYAFFHAQDLAGVEPDASIGLWIGFGCPGGDDGDDARVGAEVVDALERQGLRCLWDGDPHVRIDLLLTWQRRWTRGMCKKGIDPKVAKLVDFYDSLSPAARRRVRSGKPLSVVDRKPAVGRGTTGGSASGSGGQRVLDRAQIAAAVDARLAKGAGRTDAIAAVAKEAGLKPLTVSVIHQKASHAGRAPA